MNRPRPQAWTRLIHHLIPAVVLALPVIAATEYHVATTGDDEHPGTAAKPLRSIQAAANRAQPGDTITVHAGMYRERINPPRGGTSDSRRIVYQSAPGARVVITGSERVEGWVKEKHDTWRVTLPNTFFGAFNPYTEILKGDWCRNPVGYHTGAVYLDGDWLTETRTREDVMQPAGSHPLWFVIVDDTNTTLWAQFPNVNPNERNVEINARRTVFYPDQPGRNFITVRGFTLRQAATPWAPPTAEQIGLIGTHWSKGWIIENNTISHSFSTGVTLGKYGDSFDNTSSNSPGGYVKTIERAHAFAIPWTKENIGHHIVRGNRISHCEQAGIAGSLGCSFSTVTGNTIHDIHVRRMIAGEEMAGIKFHGAIDTLIARNHVYRCNRGIWLDWMAQGARVTGNLLHDNASSQVDWPTNWEALVSGGEQDMFLEVNHGPVLVDNNILLSPYAVNDRSQGVALVHNLFAGAFRVVRHDHRMTPYLKPHSTEVVALHDHPCGDHRIYNNIFVKHPDLGGFDSAKTPVSMHGNVYLTGAKPSKHEATPLVLPRVDARLRLVRETGGWQLAFTANTGWRDMLQPRLVNTESLGNALVPNQPFTNADGSPLRIDTDYFERKRRSDHPLPGPFETLGPEETTFTVWQAQGS